MSKVIEAIFKKRLSVLSDDNEIKEAYDKIFFTLFENGLSTSNIPDEKTITIKELNAVLHTTVLEDVITLSVWDILRAYENGKINLKEIIHCAEYYYEGDF